MADKMEGKSTESSKQSEQKRAPGIIYLSRLPPFMKPAKVRYIFSQFGEIGRLFLQPEDSLIRKKRKKYGGSGRKTFTEGWVEFKDKRIAKAVAVSLNNTIIGGKKKSYYHDDIWNIKYLPKFLWTHLGERMAYEKATRKQRMRTEISQAKKEANFYLQNVEKGKEIEAIVAKKQKKLGKKPGEKRQRTFIQHDVIGNKKKCAKGECSSVAESGENKGLSNDLLKKIFSAR